MNNKKNKAFTLVELLVVVAIISLLVLISVFSIRNIKSKSHDVRRVGDISSLQSALALYHNDMSAYPVYNGYILGTDVMSVALINNGTMKYIPKDPLDTGEGVYRYHYESTQGKTYVIKYYLETNTIPSRPAGENIVVP